MLRGGPGECEPLAERHHWTDDVEGPNDVLFKAIHEEGREVADIHDLRRHVRLARDEYRAIRIASATRHPSAGPAGVVARSTDQPGACNEQAIAVPLTRGVLADPLRRPVLLACDGLQVCGRL